MANLISKRSWDKTVRLDGDAPKLKPGSNNIIHNAVLAKTVQDIRDGNFEDMGNLQKVANLFTMTEESAPIKIGSKTTTVLADGKGKLHTIVDDPANVKTFLENGMTVHSVKCEDVFDR